jgi:glycosyltransferase involved in cell wall biosynthesis
VRVTCIFLSYNCERNVAEALRSMLAQDHREPMEIIISDDASSDSTFDVLREHVEEYKGPHAIRLLRQPRNTGSKSAHLNEIFPLARGELLVSFDSDDISEPQRVRRIASAFAADPQVRAVYSAVSVIDERGRARGAGRVPHPPDGHSTRRWFANVDAYASGATLAIHREVFDSFPALDPAIHEDVVLPFRASLLGEVVFLDEPLVQYRRHGASLTADFGRFRSLDAYRERMLKGIARARIHLGSRIEDIDTMRRLQPIRGPEWDTLERIAKRSLECAEMTAPLFSPRSVERWVALARVAATGAYPQDLAQNAAIALAPRSYLRFKRRRLSLQEQQE